MPKGRALSAKGANYKSEGSRRMHPSPKPTRGATRVTILPEAGREEQMERWGLNPSAHWPEISRWGHGPDDAVDVYDGDAVWDDPDQAARELEERGFIIEGGWAPVAIKNNSLHSGGLTAHRGVLHPEEYVDQEALRAMVEDELGFTYEQVRSVYRQGPLSADQRELRGQIDARLLVLSRAGGEMTLLAGALGWEVDKTARDGGPSCKRMRLALNRARAAEGVAA
jgi:hypothetical protein